MSRPDRDEDLVRRAAGGDRDAFDRLVARHQDRVYGVCLRIMGDPDDARDAAQETFLSVLRALPRFRGESAFSTWLYRVTVNACYDELRRAKRRPFPRALDEEGPPDGTPAPVADHADEVAGTRDVTQALASIPLEHRTVLVLADVEDLPYERIAQVLGVPVGTVKSRVHRGRLALARALGASGEPDHGPAASEGAS